MPELPEVETIRRQLNRVLGGQKIRKIKVLRDKSWKGDKGKVEGKKIKKVERKAKILIIELENGRSLLIHLKMTGQLVWVKKQEKEGKHTRVVLKLDKGRLFFNDLRVFGWIKVVDKKDLENEFKNYGPDVNGREFTKKHLKEILGSSRRSVKLILLDQKKLAGVGNIYANEALYCAGVDPQKTGVKVAKDEKMVGKLFKCLKQVIEKGIKYGGSTASDRGYKDGLGREGKYQKHFLIYEKAGEKCKRCKGEIKKVKLGGRGTYFCPGCQK